MLLIAVLIVLAVMIMVGLFVVFRGGL